MRDAAEPAPFTLQPTCGARSTVGLVRTRPLDHDNTRSGSGCSSTSVARALPPWAHGGSALATLVEEHPEPERVLSWSSGRVRTSPTVDRAPHVGWSVKGAGSAASRMSDGHYWLGVDKTTEALQAANIFGSLYRDCTDTGVCPLPTEERLDQFGLYHEALNGPFKNAYGVGDWVLPGLGLESDGLTAWQTANAITKAASSFWKSGPKR